MNVHKNVPKIPVPGPAGRERAVAGGRRRSRRRLPADRSQVGMTDIAGKVWQAYWIDHPGRIGCGSRRPSGGEIGQRAAAVGTTVLKTTIADSRITRPLTLTKGIFPALASLPVLLLTDRSGGLRLLARKRFRVLPSALQDAWEARTP